ncbi:hypothetical protein I4U23_031561 [Adineta vaga]|nr:hypothetical protein I4U23_031561 [Adineta vaga]
MVRKKLIKRNLIDEEKENNNQHLELENKINYVTTEREVSGGQKRPIELVDLNLMDEKDAEIIKLKKRCFDLEQRIEVLEKTSLVIPQDMSINQELFGDISLFSNDSNNNIMIVDNTDSIVANVDNTITFKDDINLVNNDDASKMNSNISLNDSDMMTTNNNDEKKEILPTTFIIDDVTLFSLKQQSATSTARSILKYLYPNPEIDFNLSNLKKSLINEIIG